MEPAILEGLIPIVAIVFGVGFIPAIVFILRYFRLRERELQLEADAQRWAEKNYTALEMRVQRLETVLLAPEGKELPDLRSRLALLEPPGGQPSEQAEAGEGQPIKVR
jgi:hypothetical protein